MALLLSMELGAMSVSTQGLVPHQASGELRVTDPALHFLTGKSLALLHDGAAVPFDFQLTVASGSKTNVVARSLERFMVSYDVWEEKFSVVRVRDFRKSGMRLSASSAEAWCLENIFVPTGALPAGQLWAHLEIRSVESKEPLAAGSGINLATLIEIFSRPSRPEQDHWSVESAPFQLVSLKQ
ncbi:MAG TPA: hypothetical protein VK724_20245 [Bryobacteraceae bacterium]|nr:hypothetical protein [Bryobacteraceae bacterium]